MDHAPPAPGPAADEPAVGAELSRRMGLALHRLVGWIFWDPGGIARYEALGVPDGFGWYVATRAAPLAPAGADAVAAAFYSIHADFVRAALETCERHTTFAEAERVRNEAVAEGLAAYAPSVRAPLASHVDGLWQVVDALPAAGRVLFGAHRDRPRPDDATTSAWLALNCIREWRGDTHWALLVADDLGGVEAGLLHDAWLGYPGEWIPRSRGADDPGLAAAHSRLAHRGFSADGVVTAAGVAHRQALEDRTDELSARPWRLLGEATTRELLAALERVGPALLARVDETAGPDWMPAARERRR